MKNASYILEPYSGISSRFDCPSCHKKKVFTRYIDTIKNEYLSYEFGKCNREIKCGYWLDPYKERIWEKEINIFPNAHKEKPRSIVKIKTNEEPSFLPFRVLLSSIKFLDSNNFIKFLQSKFGSEFAEKAVKSYFIGTSKHWDKIGASIFWQVDYFGNVRSGKIMAYDSESGKRIKKPFNHITWVHKVLGLEDFNLSQCYFGEHLLKMYQNKPVAIVESEKTAIIASFYFPEYVWIASGSLNNISVSKSENLYGRKILLVPDVSENQRAFELWSQKAKELSEISDNIQVLEILETLASKEEKEQGLDLADFLIRIPISQFHRNNVKNRKNDFYSFDEYINGLHFENRFLINGFGYPADWDTISGFKEIDSKTKEFIKMTSKNPVLLELQRRFGLDLR